MSHSNGFLCCLHLSHSCQHPPASPPTTEHQHDARTPTVQNRIRQLFFLDGGFLADGCLDEGFFAAVVADAPFFAPAVAADAPFFAPAAVGDAPFLAPAVAADAPFLATTTAGFARSFASFCAASRFRMATACAIICGLSVPRVGCRGITLGADFGAAREKYLRPARLEPTPQCGELVRTGSMRA